MAGKQKATKKASDDGGRAAAAGTLLAGASQLEGYDAAAAAAATTVTNENPFQTRLPRSFVILSYVILCLFAFGLGRTSRSLVLSGLMRKFYPDLYDPPSAQQPSGGITSRKKKPIPETDLPQPILPRGKSIPKTIYSSKQFSTALPYTSDNVLLSRRPTLDHGEESMEIVADGSMKEHNESEEDEDDEEHLPVGQHLLVDMENVSGNFLNSEEQLATAMLELINESGLTLLSYHCHSLEPMGVSCVGVLLESHVSFHTWPMPGVICFDIFTCGATPLTPLLGSIERLFAIPKKQSPSSAHTDPPRMVWAFKERGFENLNGTSTNPESEEFNHFLRGTMGYEVKKEVLSVDTDFQTISIFDTVNPRVRSLESYRRSLTDDGSYESKNPQLFLPDRVLYLDQVMQSRRYGDSAYHESLVHPAMLAHDDPRRVAIIGGGEGATLREVLKHGTLEKVVMIEIDEVMVNASRKYLPEWSDCSNLAGSTSSSCFEQPRAEVYYEDAIAWFINRFGEGVQYDPSDRFDVIIMDALDPSSATEFSDILYKNHKLMVAVSNSMTEEGILVSQVGQSVYAGDPPTEFTREATLETSFIPQLAKHGFEKIKSYEDMHGGFMAAWNFLLAFKDSSTLENWYANEALVDLAIRERVLATKSGESSLRYFDGATMNGFAYPSKLAENVFCLKNEKPPHCSQGGGFDPGKQNSPISSFEVKESSIPAAGRGVYSKVAIPKGSYVAADEQVHGMLVLPPTRRTIKEMRMAASSSSVRWKVFESYFFGYGYGSDFYGDASYNVDASILTFLNHGCNGSNNVGWKTTVTEETADLQQMPPELSNTFESEVYNPFVDRNFLVMLNKLTTAKDIGPNEEIFDNFLSFLHEENWEWGVQNYRSMCDKSGSAGVVSAYEENAEEASVEF